MLPCPPLGAVPHRRDNMYIYPRPLLVVILCAVSVFNSASGMNIDHAGLEDQSRLHNQYVLPDYINKFLQDQPAAPSMNDGHLLWGLLYDDPSTMYDPGFTFKKRQDQAWYSGYGKKRSTGAKRQQGWHVNYGKRSKDVIHGQGSQVWFSGYGKRDTRRDEPYGIRRWPSPSLLLHPPWYDYVNDVKEGQFVDFDKRQPGWYTSYGKRQQGWYNPYG